MDRGIQKKESMFCTGIFLFSKSALISRSGRAKLALVRLFGLLLLATKTGAPANLPLPQPQRRFCPCDPCPVTFPQPLGAWVTPRVQYIYNIQSIYI